MTIVIALLFILFLVLIVITMKSNTTETKCNVTITKKNPNLAFTETNVGSCLPEDSTDYKDKFDELCKNISISYNGKEYVHLQAEVTFSRLDGLGTPIAIMSLAPKDPKYRTLLSSHMTMRFKYIGGKWQETSRINPITVYKKTLPDGPLVYYMKETNDVSLCAFCTRNLNCFIAPEWCGKGKTIKACQIFCDSVNGDNDNENTQ